MMKRTIILALVLGVFFSLSSLSTAADWMYYATDSHDNDWLYDRESISFPSKGIVHVLRKVIVSEQGRAEEILYRTQRKMSTDGFSELSERMCKEQINCNTREFTVVACVQYSKTGRVLDSANPPKENQEWVPIYPDTIVDKLRETVCKLQPKETKKMK